VKLKFDIDPNYLEPEIIVRASEVTDEIKEMVQRLSVTQQKLLAGFADDRVQVLDIAEIIRIYSLNKKVFAQTMSGEFLVRMRLYELEERLDKTLFVRISNSEIVNLKAIRKIDLSFAGTIAIILSNDGTSYVSRRYISKLKQALGM
jgi:DNA-binding LytR/AlgR family response regulator